MSSLIHATRRHVTRSHRRYSTQNATSKPRSAHAQWYSDMLPGMIPVALLGSAVYIGLRLYQANLAHEKYLDETRARVQELERELEELQKQATTPAVAGTEAGTEGAKGRRGWLW